MNKWDAGAFACLSLGLAIGFMLPAQEWFMIFKFLLFAVGAYLLWYKGNLFKLGQRR